MEINGAQPSLLGTAISMAVLKQVRDQLQTQGEALVNLIEMPIEQPRGDDNPPHLGRFVDVRV